MSTPTTENEKRAHLREMINHIRAAVLVTRNQDGSMHGRPMSTADVDEHWDRIWFATARDSGKVAEIADDDHVYLGYAKGAEFVSISGRARTVRDVDKARQLWSPLWKNWFKGPEDSNLLLLEVTPDIAEYWDSGSRIFALAVMAAAAVTGKHFEVGQNEKVQFQGTT